MDEVAPFFVDLYADTPNEDFSEAELTAMGGEQALRRNPVVEKVEIDPVTHRARVWLDLKALKYSKDEQAIMLNNLKTLVLFAEAAEAAKKKAHR